jgi:hypothetical protein
MIMNCDSEKPEFSFSQEQSKELGDLVLNFLAKYFEEDILSGIAVEVEVKFTPKLERDNDIEVRAFVGGGDCYPGPPNHPFCPRGQTWR